MIIDSGYWLGSGVDPGVFIRVVRGASHLLHGSVPFPSIFLRKGVPTLPKSKATVQTRSVANGLGTKSQRPATFTPILRSASTANAAAVISNRFHREMTQKNAETVSNLSSFYLDDAAVPPRLAPLLTSSAYLTSKPWHHNPAPVTSQLTRRRWRRWRRWRGTLALGLQDTRSVETSSDNDVKFTPDSNGFYWHRGT